jgi:hypothetical protein
MFFFGHLLFKHVNLLHKRQLRGDRGWCTWGGHRGGGDWHNGGSHGGGRSGFPGVRIRTVSGVGGVVLGAVASHVALGAASETTPLGTVLSAFLVGQLSEWYSYISGVNIHRDVLVIG